MDPASRGLTPPAISAVLPAYNEDANLERTLRELEPVLARAASEFEIIVVDDGSEDRTAEVAAGLTPAVRGLRVLHHERNLGYGAALRTGFAAARCGWTLLMDADGQFRPEELPRLVAAAAGGPDLVLGFREKRADPARRRWYAAAWGVLMRLLFGLRVRDVDCAFKLMRTDLIQSLDLEAGGAFISAELLVKARRCGARMVEVPVSHRPRVHGRPTGGDVRILFRALRELLSLWRRVQEFALPREPGEATPRPAR